MRADQLISRTEVSADWQPGCAPVAVILLSLNEEHNIKAVLDNLKGWAQEVFLVDSFSRDDTVRIASARGVHVVQRAFHGFGDQWNFALSALPVTAPWTMKLDPDERLSDELKQNIAELTSRTDIAGWTVRRRLWFMGRPLPVTQVLLRGWRTGSCRFSDVLVNEHPLVEGKLAHADGHLEHHDSPDLHHWYDKQNRYSSTEAINAYRGSALSAMPRLFGNRLERRMWLKSRLLNLPFRSLAVFLYCYAVQGAWRAGRVGFIWSRLRADVYRMRANKLLELRLRGRELHLPPNAATGSRYPVAAQSDHGEPQLPGTGQNGGGQYSAASQSDLGSSPAAS